MKSLMTNHLEELFSNLEEAHILDLDFFPNRNEIFLRVLPIGENQTTEVRFCEINYCFFAQKVHKSNAQNIECIGLFDYPFVMQTKNDQYPMQIMLTTLVCQFFLKADQMICNNNIHQFNNIDKETLLVSKNLPALPNYKSVKTTINHNISDIFDSLAGARLMWLAFQIQTNSIFLRIMHPKNNSQIRIRFSGVYTFFYQNRQTETNETITLQKLTYLEKPFILQRKEFENETFAFHFELQTEKQHYYFNAEEVVID